MKRWAEASRLIRVLFWLSLVGIFTLSVLPTDRLPPISASLWDKAQHALAFVLLAVLALQGWSGRHQTRILLGLFAFGVIIELAQAGLGWRHGEVADVVADAVGIAIGWWAVTWVNRQRNRRPT
jgi:VanZ family protein